MDYEENYIQKEIDIENEIKEKNTIIENYTYQIDVLTEQFDALLKKYPNDYIIYKTNEDNQEFRFNYQGIVSDIESKINSMNNLALSLKKQNEENINNFNKINKTLKNFINEENNNDNLYFKLETSKTFKKDYNYFYKQQKIYYYQLFFGIIFVCIVFYFLVNKKITLFYENFKKFVIEKLKPLQNKSSPPPQPSLKSSSNSSNSSNSQNKLTNISQNIKQSVINKNNFNRNNTFTKQKISN